jgi:hypothetical protein
MLDSKHPQATENAPNPRLMPALRLNALIGILYDSKEAVGGGADRHTRGNQRFQNLLARMFAGCVCSPSHEVRRIRACFENLNPCRGRRKETFTFLGFACAQKT